MALVTERQAHLRSTIRDVDVTRKILTRRGFVGLATGALAWAFLGVSAQAATRPTCLRWGNTTRQMSSMRGYTFGRVSRRC